MDIKKLLDQKCYVFNEWSEPQNEYNQYMGNVLDKYSKGKTHCSFSEFANFCVDMFWCGCQYRMKQMRWQIEDGAMWAECAYKVFIDSLQYALTKDLLSHQAGQESYTFLVAMGKVAFNNGVRYANNRLKYAVKMINGSDDTIS